MGDSKTLRRARQILKSAKGGKRKAGLRLVGEPKPVKVLPSGVASIDVASGIGGYPWGREIIMHSEEGLGKTTLALLACAEAQAMGGVAVWLDYECKLDEIWAQKMGVNTDELIVCNPDHIEDGMIVIENALASRIEEIEEGWDPDYPVLFVWDSLQAAGAKTRIEKDYDEGHFAPEPNVYSSSLKKLVPQVFKAQAIVLATSQVRVDIGGFRAKEKVGVGRAWNHHATQILLLQGTRLKGATIARGNKLEVFFHKNQVAKPKESAHFDFHDGLGVYQPSAIVEAALALNLIDVKAGGNYTIDMGNDEVVKFKGAGAIAQMAPEKLNAIRARIYDRIGQ